MCYYFKNQIFFKKSATLLYCFFDIDLEKTNLAIFEDFSEIFYGLKLKAGLSYDKIVSYAMSKDTFKCFVLNALCSKEKQLRGIRPDFLEIHLL